MHVAASQVGVRELTGKNDGPEVEAYLASVGLEKGQPYCAAFVYWVGREALGPANPYPRTAWSPSMVAGGEKVTAKTKARRGDTFGIYFPSKKRVAHTGLVDEWGDGASVWTCEGNTSGTAKSGSAADRDGQGVFRKKRLKASIYNVRDWIGAGLKPCLQHGLVNSSGHLLNGTVRVMQVHFHIVMIADELPCFQVNSCVIEQGICGVSPRVEAFVVDVSSLPFRLFDQFSYSASSEDFIKILC